MNHTANRIGLNACLFAGAFLALFAFPFGEPRAETPPLSPHYKINDYFYPVAGESELVYNSNPDYINDHTVIRAEDGIWHMVGITHKKILGGALPVPTLEEEFAHASAPALRGPWTELPRVLKADLRLLETHVWAPYIIYHDGLYYCFYAGGGGHWWSMINLATSPDLMTWTRYDKNPLFRDYFDARDPMILRVGDKWVMYYTKTYSHTKWRSTVAYRASANLLDWSEPRYALILKNPFPYMPNSGRTESPFALYYEGLYYLFVCTPDLGYKATIVYVSDSPYNFREEDEIATLNGHAAEIVKDGDKYYMTHAGWFFDGLYLAPLKWKKAHKLSPPMLFADSGDNKNYLVSAPGARKVRRGLSQALKAGEGQFIEYRFPVPDGVSKLSLVFEGAGEIKVTAGEITVMDEKDAGKGKPEIHIIEISDKFQWIDGYVIIRFSDSSADRKDGPVISYVKLYYR